MDLQSRRKGTVQIDMTPEIKREIQKCQEENRLFGVFPTIGDSMTCKDKTKSIPAGSKVFAIEINYKPGIQCLGIILNDKPLLILGKDQKGKPFAICKTIAFQDYVNGNFLLRSYNPAHNDAWIPYRYIQKIFEVKQIVTI